MITDHNSIVARFGGLGNEFTPETKQKLNFDKESHLKSKESNESQENHSCRKKKSNKRMNVVETFRRKIINPDMSSCWLNACLHLILTALDHSESEPNTCFTSELGKELLRIQKLNVFNPTATKDIIAFAEDTRIALRKSEVISKNPDPQEQLRQLRQIDQIHLDLRLGQQCVRDFFLCLNENALNWIDLHEFLSFDVMDSTMCNRCQNENISEHGQIYLEMEVPPDGSLLGEHIEEYFSESYFVEYVCDLCQYQLAEKRMFLKSAVETNCITILLRRSVQGEDGNEIVVNKIKAVDDIKIT